ncbi:MAG: NAD(P)H dehydrogenase (quinone), Type IV [uncultured Acetobacteraceae bacterium]|uniref:NAD(P)H dehydrogenase (Quinone), Type IV n=1 Tax=uncultured Acetobacteraceae bacterium TaxID=169975 RepID=A0A6J4I9I2_9PROT|nr:MAG: NAD(P)H dehydrogenase (quinone), Type IV [uncultured Acetobacteraceae bacterium]
MFQTATKEPKVLIAFYSRSGVTEALADAVAEGARADGAEVRLRRARELVPAEVMAKAPGWREAAEAMNAKYEAPTEADAEWADAIVFGTPTRFGSVSSELKAYIDGLGGLWAQGRLNGKAGSVFGSTSTPHGGNESTLISMYNPMAHLGLVIVPLGYADPAMYKAGTPYGASAVSFNQAKPPTDDDREVARFQGRRVAFVARALKAARITDTKQGQADQVGASQS